MIHSLDDITKYDINKIEKIPRGNCVKQIKIIL